MTPQSKKNTIKKQLTIQNKLGLHARPAALFVQTANRYKSSIEVEKEGEKVNGKSIMGIMTLAAGIGTTITIKVTGADAQEAMKEIEELFESNFGENEEEKNG